MLLTTLGCPFCGCNDLEFMLSIGPLSGQILYFVFCTRCHAKGPRHVDSEQAVSAWGLRATSFPVGLLRGYDPQPKHKNKETFP